MDWTEKDFARNENNGSRVSLHYWQKGSGPPILLLHGITDTGACWGRTADALAERFTVYALDQRGHGQSDVPENGYALADCVADAAALLRTVHAVPSMVMGHSYGAILTMMLAAQQPELVSKPVLVDPPMWDGMLQMPAEGADERRLKFFDWLIQLQDKSHEELVAHCHAQSPNWTDEECEQWATSKHQVRPRVWQKDGTEFGSDWRADISHIKCPTLFVRGEPACGGIVSDADLADVKSLLQNGQVVTVAQAGHSVQRDRNAEFMAVVLPFLLAASQVQ